MSNFFVQNAVFSLKMNKIAKSYQKLSAITYLTHCKHIQTKIYCRIIVGNIHVISKPTFFISACLLWNIFVDFATKYYINISVLYYYTLRMQTMNKHNNMIKRCFCWGKCKYWMYLSCYAIITLTPSCSPKPRTTHT